MLTRPNQFNQNPFQALLIEWSKESYTPIDESSELRDQILNLPIVQKTEVAGEVQVEKIRLAAYDLVMAFYGDTYEAFLKCRTPIAAKNFNLEAIEAQSLSLSTDWRNHDKTVPRNPDQVHRRYWEVVFLNKHVDPGTEILNSTVGQHLFKGICFPKSRIVIEETRAPLVSIVDYIAQQGSAGAFTPYSSFVFERTPESILEQDKTLKFAVVTLLLEFPKPEPACPLYCRYYWDQASLTWLPIDIGMAIPGFLRTRELVF
jgi:hypothetical protein